MSPSSSLPTIKQYQTVLIIRSICTLFNAFCVVKLIKDNVFSLLNKDSIEMEKWDPTEIIAVPVPLDVIKPLVYRSCLNIIIPIETIVSSSYLSYRQKSEGRKTTDDGNYSRKRRINTVKSIFNYFLFLTLCHAVVFLVAISSGASPTDHIHHTLLATTYLSTLAFGYIQPGLELSLKTIEKVLVLPDYFHHPGAAGVDVSDHRHHYSSDDDHEKDEMDRNMSSEHGATARFDPDRDFIENLGNEMNSYIVYATCGMTIPFMILNILDHGNQLQRWPVPILLGSLVGHVVGVLMGIIMGWYRLHQLRKARLLRGGLKSMAHDTTHVD